MHIYACVRVCDINCSLLRRWLLWVQISQLSWCCRRAPLLERVGRARHLGGYFPEEEEEEEDGDGDDGEGRVHIRW